MVWQRLVDRTVFCLAATLKENTGVALVGLLTKGLHTHEAGTPACLAVQVAKCCL